MDMVFTDTISAEEYMVFRQAAGWSLFPIEQAQQGLDNSYVFCLRRGDKPVGIGRFVWDHGYVVYIADVIVMPEYQGMGYGRMIMERMMSAIKGLLKPGYKIMVSLLSAQGKEDFYTRFGFDKRPSERFGCGMCQWISYEDGECEVCCNGD